MIEQDLDNWQQEVRERAVGEDGHFDPLLLAFKCPKCGNIATGEDFAMLGQGLSAEKAATNCLGRFSPDVECDWAAYGLFGTLGKGRLLRKPDGETVEVFDFADPDPEEPPPPEDGFETEAET